ncbi:MAG: MOSC N-terminal beta barrel domain-containing protein [Cycloclasticus sp.]|nr:MOSC N-terminal beta barrel domain-containing protein [Cycloclasticus sp.]
MATLGKIFVYPIKALPGVELSSVEITKGGTLSNDRRWALLDKKGRLVNGKNNSKVFSLRPRFDLALEEVCFVGDELASKTFQLADVKGLSNYFSERLGKAVFLKEDTHQGFPDDMNASGPTLVSQASLEAVSSWYPDLTLDDIRQRFRINMEISGVPAFWEDRCFLTGNEPKMIRVGQVDLQSSNPCARCSVPIKDAQSGKPYDNFYETFIEMRESTKPAWTDESCFDHWYRLSVNTNINAQQGDKKVSVGDAVDIL